MNKPVTAAIQAQFSHAFAIGQHRTFSLDVELSLPAKGITAIFGESGSGKTTLLRCIAGLEKVQQGSCTVRGDVWQSTETFVPTHRRPLAYVFQEASLFPHLTAFGNLRYAMKRSDSTVSEQDFDRIVALMGIARLDNQYPDQLSGGERQRVAIARALLIKPRLLLMDEPLASLDAMRKREIMPYLEKLHDELELPILYVTHSLDEVARLADYLVVLEQGRILAQGSLSDVLGSIDLPLPLGEENGIVVDASVVERDLAWHLVRAQFAGGELWVKDSGDAIGQHIRIRILARDVSLALESHDDTSILNRLPSEVVEIQDDSDEAMALIRLAVGSTTIIARVSRRSVDKLQLGPGSKVWAQIKSVAILR